MLQQNVQLSTILQKTKSNKWENRAYIKGLVLLVDLMLKQKLNDREGQLYFDLRNQYQEEYLSMIKAYNPIMHQVLLEEQHNLLLIHQDQNKIMQQQQQRIVEEEKAQYQHWLTLQKHSEKISLI